MARLAALLVLAASACAHGPAPRAGETLAVRCRGDGAVRVWLLGSFNGWGEPLALTREGRDFTGTLPLAGPIPVSATCLRELTDGGRSSEAPLDAPRREPDGFGGENGLFGEQ